MTLEDFKDIYKNISKEDILKQFYFEHNDLMELNSANEIISKCSEQYKEKMIKYRNERNKLNKQNYELKQRIEKTIKFIINEFEPSESNQEIIFINNLMLYKILDILKGSEDNE